MLEPFPQAASRRRQKKAEHSLLSFRAARRKKDTRRDCILIDGCKAKVLLVVLDDFDTLDHGVLGNMNKVDVEIIVGHRQRIGAHESLV